MPSRQTSSASSSSRSFRANFLLAAVSTLVSLGIAWVVWEKHQAAKATAAHPKLAAVQEHLVLHSALGFLWRPNLDVLFPTELQWLDAEYEGIEPRPIVTDGDGFMNHPRAIAKADAAIDVIGLGDSFVHDMAFALFEFFEERGLSYYSLAMHRHSPPQYNRILRDYALPRRPKQIIYGLYENDFRETEDFEQWQRSGQDWFAYHGGLWGGQPPKPVSHDRRTQLASVLRYIREAHQLCERNGIEFTVLMIPSKQLTVFRNRSLYDSRVYNQLVQAMDAEGIPYLDLRPVFRGRKNVGTLYWKKDSHWSYTGARLAASAYLESRPVE